MRRIGCAVALVFLLPILGQEYTSLTIRIDDFARALVIDSCSSEHEVGSAVSDFASRWLSDMTSETCPSGGTCIREGMLVAAMNVHNARRSACRVGLLRAESLPAVAVIVGQDGRWVKTILLAHGELLEDMPASAKHVVEQKRSRQSDVMRYGSDFTRPLTPFGRVLAELLRLEMLAVRDTGNGDWWDTVEATLRKIVLRPFDARYFRRWEVLHGIMDATNTVELLHRDDDLFVLSLPDIDEITVADGPLQAQYSQLVAATPANRRYERLAREGPAEPGAPVVFQAHKLDLHETYSASSLGYAWLLLTYENALLSAEFRLEAANVIVEFGPGIGLFPKLLRQNLGYRMDYVLWDLPTLSNLQAYHLRSAG